MEGEAGKRRSIPHPLQIAGCQLVDAAVHRRGLGDRGNEALLQQAVGHGSPQEDQIWPQPPGCALLEFRHHLLLAHRVEADPHIGMQAVELLQQGHPQPFFNCISPEPVEPPLGHHHHIEGLSVDEGQRRTTLEGSEKKQHKGQAPSQKLEAHGSKN